ncbi:uncharacterized protein LOC132263268 [Phlebotomus argentipes]|uniref:uncharacterized protein LOC132263268 n=1 Tax=Phlebotomus argentipes TaxID=94469 RepID=UPI002892F6C0|nr:uncharacterized protein LOC132263268 [Phlebotomus argentipes]
MSGESSKVAIPDWFLNSNVHQLVRRFIRKSYPPAERVDKNVFAKELQRFYNAYTLSPTSRRSPKLSLHKLVIKPPEPSQTDQYLLFKHQIFTECSVDLSKRNYWMQCERKVYEAMSRMNEDIRSGKAFPQRDYFTKLTRLTFDQNREMFLQKAGLANTNSNTSTVKKKSTAAPLSVLLRRKELERMQEAKNYFMTLRSSKRRAQNSPEDVAPKRTCRYLTRSRTAKPALRFERATSSGNVISQEEIFVASQTTKESTKLDHSYSVRKKRSSAAPLQVKLRRIAKAKNRGMNCASEEKENVSIDTDQNKRDDVEIIIESDEDAQAIHNFYNTSVLPESFVLSKRKKSKSSKKASRKKSHECIDLVSMTSEETIAPEIHIVTKKRRRILSESTQESDGGNSEKNPNNIHVVDLCEESLEGVFDERKFDDFLWSENLECVEKSKTSKETSNEKSPEKSAENSSQSDNNASSRDIFSLEDTPAIPKRRKNVQSSEVVPSVRQKNVFLDHSYSAKIVTPAPRSVKLRQIAEAKKKGLNCDAEEALLFESGQNEVTDDCGGSSEGPQFLKDFWNASYIPEISDDDINSSNVDETQTDDDEIEVFPVTSTQAVDEDIYHVVLRADDPDVATMGHDAIERRLIGGEEAIELCLPTQIEETQCIPELEMESGIMEANKRATEQEIPSRDVSQTTNNPPELLDEEEIAGESQNESTTEFEINRKKIGKDQITDLMMLMEILHSLPLYDDNDSDDDVEEIWSNDAESLCVIYVDKMSQSSLLSDQSQDPLRSDFSQLLDELVDA